MFIKKRAEVKATIGVKCIEAVIGANQSCVYALEASRWNRTALPHALIDLEVLLHRYTKEAEPISIVEGKKTDDASANNVSSNTLSFCSAVFPHITDSKMCVCSRGNTLN